MRVARGSALCLLVLASLESAFGEPDAAVEAEELDLADLESDEDDGGEAEGEAEDFDKDMPMEVRLVRMKVCLAGASARLHSNAEAVAKLAEELVESRPGISKEQATNSVFFTWMMTCYMNIGEERAQQAADGDAEVLKDLRLYEPNPENVYNAQSASRSQWSFLIDVVKEHVADQEAALKAQEKAQRSSSGSSGSSNSGQMPPVQEPPTPSAGNKASILLLAVVFGIIGLATMFLMRKEKEEQERRKAKKEPAPKKAKEVEDLHAAVPAVAAPRPVAAPEDLDFEALGIEDAPDTSLAWSKVVYSKTKKACTFGFRSEGTTTYFQTTVGATFGNLEAAMRIARACYHEFELGKSKPEVEQYRSEAYARLGVKPKVASSRSKVSAKAKEEAEEATSAPPKRRAQPQQRDEQRDEQRPSKQRPPKRGKRAELEKNQKEQLTVAVERLTGAVEILGRAPKKKNSTVNGLYLRLPDFGGSAAYERYLPAGSSEARRLLYYSQERARWKIAEGLGDRRNFAFLKVKDGGQRPPSEAPKEEQWTFFEGKELGWQQDPDVKCVQYVKHDRPAPPKAKAEAAVSSDSEGSSSSDSEGESSASSSASGSSPGSAGPAVAKPELSAASKGSRARACAKMMVRAGLRCGCHFETQCPERSRGHRGPPVATPT